MTEGQQVNYDAGFNRTFECLNCGNYGLFDVESVYAIMKGWEIYYNFITRHQILNCCPYELATNLKLNSENKWLDLIYLASQKS